MPEHAPTEVFVTLTAAPDGGVCSAWSSERGLRHWDLSGESDDTRADDAVRELLAFCADAVIVSFEATTLSKLLSRPAILPHARKALASLRDLRELAVICLPTEKEYSLQALGDLRPDPDLPPQMALTFAVWLRIQRVIEDAPAHLLTVLRPLLAGETSFGFVPWPEDPAGAMALMQIAKLLPQRPPPRRGKRATDALQGDIRDLATEMLSPGGPVEETHPAYEHRAGQVEMAGEVGEALREGGFLLVEAGTGVGKSLAYLIPAIIWSRRAGEPVIISTNTKNLQQQLIDQDVPLLQQAMPIAFEAALLKGRANYPCIRALVALAVDAAAGLFRGERLAAAYVISWLAASENGDLEQLSPAALEAIPDLPRLIARVRSQADACIGRKCSYNDCCPVMIARAHARRADIVVSNHALTFEDTKASILPEYSRLIFDEAQNIETVATESLSLECSRFSFTQLARDLSGDPSSLAALMDNRLANMQDDPELSAARDALGKLPALADALADVADAFGDMVYDFSFLASDRSSSDAERASARLTEEAREAPEWKEIVNMGAEVLSHGARLLEGIDLLMSKLAEADKEAQPGSEGLDADAQALRTRAGDALQALAVVLNATGDASEHVTWAEAWRSRRGPAWSLHAAPVDIGPVLDEAIYQNKEAVVFTSATITVDGEFDYFRRRLGLDPHHDRLAEALVPSPFDLTQQLLLCVPSDIPEAGSREFADGVIDALRRICEVTEGGTLALFTARTRMNRAFERLADHLRDMGLTPLCQDISGPRPALLDQLREDPRAVLFGLKSFWEGVDVPGQALRCVVICKLPFAVPTDPIIEARQEDAARKGFNPMMDYYIPEAITGFKQGFGRLIRTTSDIGVVFVLDRRLLTRPYGRRFFRSIQRCELSRESLDDCLAQARGWLGNH